MRAVAFDQIGPHIVKAEHLRIDQRPFEIIGGRRARIVDEVRDFLLKAGPGFHRDRIAPEGCAVGFPDDAALDEKVPSCAFPPRSEEQTSELQSLMRHSYAVFCLPKKKQNHDSDKKAPYNNHR